MTTQSAWPLFLQCVISLPDPSLPLFLMVFIGTFANQLKHLWTCLPTCPACRRPLIQRSAVTSNRSKQKRPRSARESLDCWPNPRHHPRRNDRHWTCLGMCARKRPFSTQFQCNTKWPSQRFRKFRRNSHSHHRWCHQSQNGVPCRLNLGSPPRRFGDSSQTACPRSSATVSAVTSFPNRHRILQLVPSP